MHSSEDQTFRLSGCYGNSMTSGANEPRLPFGQLRAGGAHVYNDLYRLSKPATPHPGVDGESPVKLECGSLASYLVTRNLYFFMVSLIAMLII